MTIDGINFHKLFKKSDVKDTSKQEASKKTSVEPEMTEEERTILSKLRNSAILSYAMGLLAIGGGASMQSCTPEFNDHDETYIDNSGIVAAINQMMELMKQQSEYLKQMVADNQDMKAYLQEIMDLNANIMDILMGIGDSVDNADRALQKIYDLLKKMYVYDGEFLDKLDEIIAGQGDTTNKLDQIIDANKEQNQLLINLQKLLDTLKDSNENIYNTVLDIFNKYQEGQISHSEMLNQILGAIQNNGSISSDILAAINDLTTQFENKQITETELLNKIISLLASIESKIDGLKDAIGGVYPDYPDLAEKLDEFIQKYEQGSMNEQQLLQQILNEMKNVSGSNSDYSAQLDQILAAINSGSLTTSEAMDKVIEMLGKIEANTGAILDALNQIGSQLGDLNANFENNQDEILELLGSINSGVGSIDSKLSQIEANQDRNNETVLDISQKLDEMSSELAQINEKTLTINQVQDMFGPMYEEIKQYLGNISGNQITVGDLEAALEAHGTDLTRTNALIQTVIDAINNLNVGSGGGDSAALQEIANAIKEFQNQSNSNSAQVNANLEAVLERLATMQGALDALVQTGNAFKDQFDNAMNRATSYGEKFLDALQNIQGSTASLEIYADQYTQYLQKAEQARQEQYAVLQAILANMGKGNSGMTVEELKAIIPDYTDILNDIKDAIGNLVTSNDLKAYFDEYAVDLTRTNALIQQVVDAINGGGTVDSSASRTLNAIRDEIQNQNPPTKDQMQELLDAIKNTPQTRSAGATYKHPGWQY